jgi:undecaprenyl diphosphate synthase
VADARREAVIDPAGSKASPIEPSPEHVAIIMDGNGRWARQRHLPTLAGHRAGTQNIRRIIQAFADYGIPCLTLYAFSTENWGRSRDEVQGLFNLLGEVIERETKALHEAGVQVRHIGSEERVPADLRAAIRRGVELTSGNSKMILNIAFNYGGRQEVADAVRRIVRDGVPADRIDADLIGRYLYTAGLPDPDLIIRTGGEMRLSNFLIWQAAYAEYYSTETLWPDFDLDEVRAALLAYSRRQRRFGGRLDD